MTASSDPAGPTDPAGDWYWCFRHGGPEHGAGCRATDRLGPYDSREAAVHWKDRVEARNEAWEDEEDDEDA